MDTRYVLKLWTRCVLLPCLAMLAIAAVATATEGGHIVATSQRGAEVCFPAKDWNAANREDRPCTTVFRPQEDGSGDLILGSVGADAATCTIPNVYEERGHFSIKCHRVRNVYGSKPSPGGSGAARAVEPTQADLAQAEEEIGPSSELEICEEDLEAATE